METTLHRQLKEIYADGDARVESWCGDYRIDVVCGDELVEIQHGSLAALRQKITKLVRAHRVLVVKPIVAEKVIVRQDARGGTILGRRLSPKRGRILDLFSELMYFRHIFPHPNLVIEVPLIVLEEWRYPGHGRRRRWRAKDHMVEDQRLVKIQQIQRFRTGRDLAQLIPSGLPAPFHTGNIADVAGIPRWFAQRIAYCFRHMGIAEEVGKQGNTHLYRFTRGVRNAA
jgi:hypothetical protein